MTYEKLREYVKSLRFPSVLTGADNLDTFFIITCTCPRGIGAHSLYAKLITASGNCILDPNDTVTVHEHAHALKAHRAKSRR